MLEEVMGSRYAAVGASKDDNDFLGCVDVLGHFHDKIKTDGVSQRRPEKASKM